MRETRRVRLLISGRVQGVYYRASTVDRARQLGLGGYARNLPDGRVEVVAEGDAQRVQLLIDWCHEGPPAARVGWVEVSELKTTGSVDRFDVRY
jgi:acylphosphatase